jgi:hypothetical protein
MGEIKEVKPPHTALSYSKWDHLEDSDDERTEEDPNTLSGKRPLDPLLQSSKTGAVLEKDEEIAKRFEGHMAEFRKAIPKKRRPLVARFVAACDKGTHSSNTFRFPDIVRFHAQYKDELFTRGIVDGMCELHKQMVESVKDSRDSSDDVIKDARRLMEAINTLEACRKQSSAAAFFEGVCNPSRGDKERKNCEQYTKQQFAKMAMMRYLFKDSEFGSSEADMEKLMEDAKEGRDPDAPENRAKKEKDEDMEWEWCLSMALFIVILIILAICSYYAIPKIINGLRYATPDEL